LNNKIIIREVFEGFFASLSNKTKTRDARWKGASLPLTSSRQGRGKD
jgi:hypothetical protein